MLSNYLFCQTNEPKPKDIKFIISHDFKKEQYILTTDQMEPVNLGNSCKKDNFE